MWDCLRQAKLNWSIASAGDSMYHSTAAVGLRIIGGVRSMENGLVEPYEVPEKPPSHAGMWIGRLGYCAWWSESQFKTHGGKCDWPLSKAFNPHLVQGQSGPAFTQRMQVTSHRNVS